MARDWREYLRQQEIKTVPIEDVKPYPNNPRDNEKAVPAVAASIERFGFRNPILVDGDGVIIEGHTRRLAAIKLGMKEVPVVYAPDLTPDEVKALRVIDNKTAELAEWDEDILAEEMVSLPDFDFGEFGFNVGELADMGLDEKDEEYDYEEDGDGKPVVEVRTKRGDVWRLGNHVLMCGDSTSEEDVARLMGGEKADCLITDPPYNVNIGARGEQYERIAEDTGKDYQCGHEDRRILNDNMSDEAFDAFLGPVFKRAAESLKPGAAFYVWHASPTQRAFENAMNAAGMEWREQLVWVKNAFTLGRQDYQWRHEPCAYGWMDGAAHTWVSDRSQTTVADLLPNAIMKRRAGAVVLKLGGKEYALKPDAVVEEVKGTAMAFPKPTRSELHPTMKPVALIRYQMENSTHYGDVVLDLFGGSGTTMIAAERSGRKCRMMELDPKYATVILDRWEAETGKMAELIGKGGKDGE